MAGISLDKAELIAIFLETFTYGESLRSLVGGIATVKPCLELTINDTFRHILHPVLDYIVGAVSEAAQGNIHNVFDGYLNPHATHVNCCKSE
jgi:hypothetical protein